MARATRGFCYPRAVGGIALRRSAARQSGPSGSFVSQREVGDREASGFQLDKVELSSESRVLSLESSLDKCECQLRLEPEGVKIMRNSVFVRFGAYSRQADRSKVE